MSILRAAIERSFGTAQITIAYLACNDGVGEMS
jgi:hypothetical protein